MNRFMKELLKKRKKRVFAVFVCTAITSALLPYSVSLLTSTVESLRASEYTEVVVFSMLYAVVYLTANLLSEAMDYLKRKMIQILQFDLKNELSDKIFSGRYAELLKVQRGDMLSYFTLGDEAVFNLLYPAFDIVGFMVTLLMSSIYIGMIDIRVLVLAYLILAVWEIAVHFLLKKGKKAAEEATAEKKNISRYISQVLEGKEDIIVWNREKTIFKALFEKHRELLKTALRRTTIYTGREQADTLIIAAAVVSAFLVSGTLCLEPSIIIALYMYINLFFSAVMELNGIVQDQKDADVNFEEIDNLISVSRERVTPYSGLKGNLLFKNIYIVFGEQVLFKGINFEIEWNKTTALWGRSGSGKTTILNILNGFVKFEGDIFFGRQKISRNGFCEIYPLISFVPQEVNLFTGTLAENICLDSEFQIDKFRRVLSDCGLTEDGFSAEKSADIEIIEGGKNLSVGQRQRVCIARAIYQDREILLLDEPTYALDSENVEIIRKLLLKLQGKKTILLSTHDDKLKSVCDSVIDVEKINEDG